MGVKKMVITMSTGCMFDPKKMIVLPSDYVISETGKLFQIEKSDDLNVLLQDYNPTTAEEAFSSTDVAYVYSAGKALAEKAIWKFADSHPDIDITTRKRRFLKFIFARLKFLFVDSSSPTVHLWPVST